jgi:hypothetical protein
MDDLVSSEPKRVSYGDVELLRTGKMFNYLVEVYLATENTEDQLMTQPAIGLREVGFVLRKQYRRECAVDLDPIKNF